jgi:hypothetical protein
MAAAPTHAAAKDATPSDPTNLLFLGTREEIASAFNEAGWFEADPLTIGSAIQTAQATIRQAGYASAPVSSLMIEGRLPGQVFQKPLDTFAKRHHLRLWKLPVTYQGRAVWVRAATHDISVDRARAGTRWPHRDRIDQAEVPQLRDRARLANPTLNRAIYESTVQQIDAPSNRAAGNQAYWPPIEVVALMPWAGCLSRSGVILSPSWIFFSSYSLPV